MSKIHLRVIVTDEEEAGEVRTLLQQSLEESEDVEAWSPIESHPRGMTEAEIAISFVISVAASLTASALEKRITLELAKRRAGKETAVETLSLDE